ncbi:MAG: TRAP transporter large permease [Clostridia bacterium]|nr:TRAP transporter large permease [Clostridia bacterium]
MVTVVLFGSFLLFLILNTPIGIALGMASLVTIIYSGQVELSYLAQSLTTSVNSFPLMAVPFFILAGELMGKGGISERLLKVGNMIFGRYTGGLAIVTVVACMFFAAISGSGPATVAAIGGIIVPEMIKRGYKKGFTSGLIATSGSIGVMIPPSIPMVIYGVSTGVSISTMFIAGLIPGILVGIALILYSYFTSKKEGYKGINEVYSAKEILSALNDAKWAMFVPIIILGGIYGGVFTPTEAAAVAVIYGFIVGTFIYKDLKFKALPDVIVNAALTTATVLIIVGTATTFGRILTIEQIPTKLAGAIIGFSDSKIVVLLLINVLLLFVGCFMETLAAVIILAPILLPVVLEIGVDPVHFGIIMVVNLAIGFMTPPLGVNLFVTCGIADISIERISRAIIPWLIVMISTLLIITYIPAISLTLPKLFGF